jgi:hypothetical protein
MSDRPYGTPERVGSSIFAFFAFGIGGFLIGVVWANAIGFDWRLGGGILGGLCALWFGLQGFVLNKDAVHGMALVMPGIGVALLILGGLVWLARALIFHW